MDRKLEIKKREIRFDELKNESGLMLFQIVQIISKGNDVLTLEEREIDILRKDSDKVKQILDLIDEEIIDLQMTSVDNIHLIPYFSSFVTMKLGINLLKHRLDN